MKFWAATRPQRSRNVVSSRDDIVGSRDNFTGFARQKSAGRQLLAKQRVAWILFSTSDRPLSPGASMR
jgi:hypothetical protein